MKKFVKILLELFFIYSFSGGVYLMVEQLFRGYTYLEMYYLAGVLGIIAYYFNNILSYNMDFLLECSILTAIGTFSEGLYGHIYNIDYHIWDYRNLKFSFWDNQCNLLFCVFWLILFLVSVPLLDYIEYKCFNGEKPYYMIFNKKIEFFK